MAKVVSKAKRRRKIISYALSSLLMLVIVYFTMRVILRDITLAEITNALTGANPYWIGAGFALMILYQLCWAEILRTTIVKLLDIHPPYIVAVNTAFMGFYFNNITPSSTGGQPFQMLYLHKCGIEAAGSSILFLVNTLFHNIVMIFIATVVIIWKHEFIMNSLYGMKYILVVGYIFNGFFFLLNLLLVYYPQKLRLLARKILNALIVKKLIRKPYRAKRRLHRFFDTYSKSSSNLWRSPSLMIKMIILHFIQFAIYFTVPYTAARALGATHEVFIPSFSLQAVLTIASSGFPTPGAVGITEGGFVTMFGSIYPKGQVEAIMVLTRLINFYIFLLIAALVTVYAFITAKKVRMNTVFK